MHDLFDPHEVVGRHLGEAERLECLGPLLRRDAEQAGKHVGHLDPGEALAEPGVSQHDRQVDRQVGDVRERVARVEGERGEGGEDLRFEVLAEQLALLLLEVLEQKDLDALFGQFVDDPVPCFVVPFQLRLEPQANGGQLLGRGHAVGGSFERSCQQLVAKSRHPDHEELVEVGREDREEFDPLEQRTLLIECLFQDAQIELQPAELTVDVELGAVQIGVRAGRAEWALDCHWSPHPLGRARILRLNGLGGHTPLCSASERPT